MSFYVLYIFGYVILVYVALVYVLIYAISLSIFLLDHPCAELIITL